MEENYTDINARTIDRWVQQGWEWGKPIESEIYERAREGDWSVLLTPSRPVPMAWFAPHAQGGRFAKTRLLGLASGGGQQMPVFAAAGALCTVLDYSDSQLDSERRIAAREGYDIAVVKGDMTRRLPFADGAFEMIFHPVSNCYVEDVQHVWNECYRVLRSGGILLAGMDNGINYLFDEQDESPLVVSNRLPYNPLKDPALMEKAKQADDGIQFSHTLEEQVGGQLRAGFTLLDLYEDSDNSLLGQHIPQFIATRARKP